MNDMSAVIVPKSDQINADDLIAGPMTISIREVRIRGGEEQPVSIYFDDSDKAFRPCKSMSRVLVQAWGADANKYVGRSLTLYRDPKVKWGGLEVGGIRISHMSDIDGEKLMMLTATKGQRKPFKVQPLVAAKRDPQPADDAGQQLALEKLTEAAGEGTEALANLWRQKWMAPHREALQLDLDRLKPIAATNDASKSPVPPGPDDAPDTNTNDVEQKDPQVALAEEIIAKVEETKNPAAAKRIIEEHKAAIEAMPQFLKIKIDIAVNNHIGGMDEEAGA